MSRDTGKQCLKGCHIYIRPNKHPRRESNNVIIIPQGKPLGPISKMARRAADAIMALA